MITTSLLALGIFLLTQVTKKFILPKWGDTGLHVFVFLVALVAFGIKGLMTVYPGFGVLVLQAGEYLVGSIAVYELIIKQLGNKGTASTSDTY